MNPDTNYIIVIVKFLISGCLFVYLWAKIGHGIRLEDGESIPWNAWLIFPMYALDEKVIVDKPKTVLLAALGTLIAGSFFLITVANLLLRLSAT